MKNINEMNKFLKLHIDTEYDKEVSLFIMAAWRGDLPDLINGLKNDKVSAHLASGSDIALRIAVSQNHTEIVKHLLTLDSVRINESKQCTSLAQAIELGKTDILSLMLSVPEIKNQASLRENMYALVAAISQEHLGVTRLMLSLDNVKEAAAPDAWLLCQAMDYNSLAGVKLLIEIPEINALLTTSNNSALQKARLKNNKEMLDLLEPFSQTHHSLCTLAFKGDLLGLKHHMNNPKAFELVAADDNLVLRKAVEGSQQNIIQYLRIIPSVIEQARLGYPAEVGEATANGKLDYIRVLLDIPEIKNNVTPIVYDQARGKNQNPPVEKYCLQLLELQLSFKEQKEKLPECGNVLLYQAVKYHHYNVVEYLLKFEEVVAKITSRNHQVLALAGQIAQQKNDYSIVGLITKHYGDRPTPPEIMSRIMSDIFIRPVPPDMQRDTPVTSDAVETTLQFHSVAIPVQNEQGQQKHQKKRCSIQ